MKNILKRIVIWAITLESRLILSKYKPFIIAVTGSVGKTSTKDAIFCALKDHEKFIRRSEKSLNSDIGLPLTVLGVANAWSNMAGWARNIKVGLSLILRKSDYPKCLVLEIGADHPGDIRKIAKWLHPDISVIARVSSTPVHVEFFKSPEHVFEEKSYLAHAVKPGGTLILFADDAKVMSLRESAEKRGVKVLSFGMSADADIRGSEYTPEYVPPLGLSFTLGIKGEQGSHKVKVKGILGSSYLYPLLAAAAVAKARNTPTSAIAASLHKYEAPKGRMNVIPGKNDSIIIDDTYNSSPDAASSALAALKSFECFGKKIAILGDMMELGKFSAEEHRKIGAEAAGVVNHLITVGPRSHATADEARKSGMPANVVDSFDSAHEAAQFASSIVMPGDVILVKGSQSVRMERVVKELLAEPDRASELIVRQEKEWLLKK